MARQFTASVPAKFDDIAKTASSVLGDDFQCKDFQLKTKQKTNFAGATSEVVVDLFGKADMKTPAKLSFKLPKPLAMFDGFAIDKLDVDHAGKIKVETSASKALHTIDGLKVEVKSDLAKEVTYASTYTGVKDSVLKFETKHTAPTDFTAEVLHCHGPAVLGARFQGTTNLCPAVGASFQFGDMFASVVAKNMFSEFTCHAFYKATDDIKVAASFQQGGKTNGAWAVGGAYAIRKDLSAKAKVESNNTVSVAVKTDLAKGLSLLAGVNSGFDGSGMKYGAKLNIE